MKSAIVLVITIIIIVLAAKFPGLMLNPGKLVEGHQKINNDCAACHKPFWGIETRRCISCHKLAEIGMKDSSGVAADEKILFHSKLKNTECTNCHSDHKGIHPLQSISTFDHSMLSEGVQSCNSCHSKPSDRLHEQLDLSCNNCHNTNTWKFSGSFDHNMIIAENRNKCSACHRKPDDSFHQMSKENCDKCHTVDKWKPSTFDHSSYFLLDKDHNAECNTCHTNNNFNAYTCYGCHEHSENKIRSEHQEHGIYNFSDCASCHKSGDEHDIRNGEKFKQDKSEVKKVKDYIKSGKEKEDEDD